MDIISTFKFKVWGDGEGNLPYESGYGLTSEFECIEWSRCIWVEIGRSILSAK